jgi:NAD(P)-dependent dehydrogenase (short-subunit alcohol dehydrogenase family)
MVEAPKPADAVLVTGGSRGIGAETCLEFARRGFDVALTFRNKRTRAEEIASRVRDLGRRALPVQADITRSADVGALAAEVAAWTTRLRCLVLNASGGLERDLLAVDPEYPMRINRDAQLVVLDRVGSLLSPPATVLHVTSHWAHLYGQVAQIPEYEPVARSKHAGEVALRARHDELAQRGIRLLVVTGALVEGTITARLLDRAAGVAVMAEHAGATVTVPDVAHAIVNAATDLELESGQTIVVGGTLASLLRG